VAKAGAPLLLGYYFVAQPTEIRQPVMHLKNKDNKNNDLRE
jgi:hypothetical protein